ncbi:MAG: S-layer protein [Candidatus Hydrothermarchaeota archaeon]
MKKGYLLIGFMIMVMATICNAEMEKVQFLPSESAVKKFDFIENYSLNSLVVVGSKSPALDVVSACDIASALGSLTVPYVETSYPEESFEYMNVVITLVKTEITKEISLLKTPISRLDTELTPEDFENYNLILVGGPKVNILVHELQEEGKLPFNITAEKPGPGKGAVMFLDNPYGTGKDVLIVAGSDREGTREASLALFNLILKN